jgi:L-alanine-DL-glutamate epimerase-like enolase superfamily enzyme
MKITRIDARTVQVRSELRNSLVSFAEMTGTIVRIESDAVHGGKTLVGLGFGSIGRYASTAIINESIVPRLMAASPQDYADANGGNIDPVRAWPIMLRNEKPGGHGERSSAVGAVDMALWDLAAKIADVPLWKLLSDRFNGGEFDPAIPVYAAGGYYHAGGLEALRAEVATHLAAGYGGVKIYQGVTLGAKSFETDASGAPVKGVKRHPDIGDHVTIYAHATILGGDTVIGAHSIVGANVWVMHPMPPHSIAYYKDTNLIVRPIKRNEDAIGSLITAKDGGDFAI